MTFDSKQLFTYVMMAVVLALICLGVYSCLPKKRGSSRSRSTASRAVDPNEWNSEIITVPGKKKKGGR